VLDAVISGPLAWGSVIAGLLLIAGVLLTVYRLVVGPTLPDRVVALDLLSMLLTALLVLLAMAIEISAYLDAALVLALVSFLSTVAFARYIERRDERPAPIGDVAAEQARAASGAQAAEGSDA
ncbi:MAG: monovalent cation/H+ antiporter complex subunit F, partial [Pseudomonadota bacterium]